MKQKTFRFRSVHSFIIPNGKLDLWSGQKIKTSKKYKQQGQSPKQPVETTATTEHTLQQKQSLKLHVCII